MENVNESKKMKQRRFLLVLPILIVPFVTLAFWALGGGSNAQQVSAGTANPGLNLDLPSANLKDDQSADKLSFYEKAKLQQEKDMQALKNDPYYNLNGASSDSNVLETMMGQADDAYVQEKPKPGLNTSPIYSEKYTDPNEVKVMNKLSQLQKEIDRPQTPSFESGKKPSVTNIGENVSVDIDRLEQMAEMMKENDADDPEMQKLETMLDKIMDIQHPERVKERIKEKSIQNKEKVFPVSSSSGKKNISLFGKTASEEKTKQDTNGFLGTKDNEDEAEQNSIEAVVHESQTLVNGSVVKLRLLNDIYINGSLIPKDNFLFGISNLNGERLNVEINSIRYGHSLFPVKLEIHDLDGLAGIYIPGGITRDVAKQSIDNGLQSIELSTLTPSIEAQAAATGINAAKSLLSKKAKLVKVAVKAGYRVLLRDKNNN